jgi:choline dehydrogenase-like flavoprotein
MRLAAAIEDRTTDVLVVGSGAAGSVLAYHLAAAGQRVLVVERGKRVRPEQMANDEASRIATLYKDGGAQTNNDADMFVLQGNVVGGSTVLTNGVTLRLPEDVRASLAHDHGWELPAEELAASYARVEDVLNVHVLERHLFSRASHRLADGMRKLGYEAGEFTKGMLRCIGCGYCNVGCHYGRKMDASQTWVPMAEARGAEFLPEVQVLELEHRGGVVHAALCRDLRTEKLFRVRAQRFVLSAGAIATPELLLRSKLGGPRVGRGVSFNAGAIAFAEYPEEVDGHLGDQMCVHHFDPRFVIEQVHNPELSFSLTLPGTFVQHAQRMRRYRRLASAGVLVPTQPVGRVFFGLGARLLPSLFDHAELRFRLPASDLAALRDGLKRLAQFYFASGATRVFVPSHQPLELQSAAEVDRIDGVVRSQTDLTNFGSSHPFGGAAAGEDPRTAPVDPEHRLRGVANLFVCDASVFPRALRVNPMLTIMAVADRAARFLGAGVPPARIEEGPVHEARLRRERARAGASA